MFAPPYERLPPDIKFFYDGLCFLHYSSTTFRLPCYCIINQNWHAGCMLMYNIKFLEELPQFLLSFGCCLCNEASGIYLVRTLHLSDPFLFMISAGTYARCCVLNKQTCIQVFF